MNKGILALFLFANTALACDCAEARRPIKKLFEFSEYVFTGKVLNLNTSKDSITHPGGTERFQEVVFEVEELFKGKKLTTVRVLNEFSDCGLPFSVGKSYMVYVFINERFNKSFVHQCHSLCPEVGGELGKKYLAEIRKFMKGYVPPEVKYPNSHLYCKDQYNYYIHIHLAGGFDPDYEQSFLLLPDTVMVYERWFRNKTVIRKFDKALAYNTINQIDFSKIDSAMDSTKRMHPLVFSMEVRVNRKNYFFYGIDGVQPGLQPIFDMFYALIPQKKEKQKVPFINKTRK